MHAIERAEYILSMLEKNKVVMVTDLSREMGVTEETVLKDLEKLEKQEKLNRVHGGAYLNEGFGNETPISVRSKVMQEGKKLLLNEDIDLIYFDIQLISKDDEFPLDIDERRLPVIAITQAHSVLKGMTKLKNRVSDFVMKPYIDELVRLRTNNLLKINISGSANEKYFSRTK